MVRGDHRVNEIKLGERARRAVAAGDRARRSTERIGPPGFIGPVGADVAVLLDEAVAPGPLRRRRPTARDVHLRGVEPGRDFALRARRRARGRGRRPRRRPPDHDRAGDRGRQHLPARDALLEGARRDLPRRAGRRAARSGWAPTGSGWRASPPPRSSSSPTSTGSPGRRRSRRSQVHLVGLGRAGQRRARARRGASTRRCATPGVEVLYDDRDAGAGEKFADAELLGAPLRLTVGRGARSNRARSRCSSAAASRRAGHRPRGARRGRRGAVPRASPERRPAARPRPLRAAAAADRRRTRRCGRGRSRTRSATRARR